MWNPKFVFVVLNYIAYNDTLECIDSILSNIEYKNFQVVIVDNCSPNNSFAFLREKLAGFRNIHLIKSEKNLGYANGINLGFNFAKNVLKADFIVALNNDTLIEQGNFIRKIIEIFERKSFFVLGPDIITSLGEHQNPLEHVIEGTEVENTIRYNYKLLKYFVLYILTNKVGFSVRNKLVKLKKALNSKEDIMFRETNKFIKYELEDVPLHGACLVFSPLYINRFCGLYNRTFLYMEEDILFYIIKREKLKTIYSPEVRIFHKEDVSTNQFLGTFNSLKKERFMILNKINSLKAFRYLVTNYCEEIRNLQNNC